MSADVFDFDSMTDDQFNKFILSLVDVKSRLDRVSVDELEHEFNGKSDYLVLWVSDKNRI